MSSTPLTGGIGTAQYGDEGFGDPYLLPNKTFHPGPLIEGALPGFVISLRSHDTHVVARIWGE